MQNGGQQNNGGGQKRQATPFMTEISNGYKIYNLKGKMYYPAILTPAKQKDGYEQFEVDVVFDVNENVNVVNEINGLVKAALSRHYPRIHESIIKMPIVDHRIPRLDGKDHPAHKAGKFSLRPHTNLARPPRVVVADPSSPNGIRDCTPMDAQMIYHGADCWVSIKVGAMENVSGKYGATTYLNGVVILGTGDRVEMRSGESVEDIFNGFLGQTAGNGGQSYQNNGQNYQNSGNQNYQNNGQNQNNFNGNFSGNGQQNNQQNYQNNGQNNGQFNNNGQNYQNSGNQNYQNNGQNNGQYQNGGQFNNNGNGGNNSLV